MTALPQPAPTSARRVISVCVDDFGQHEGINRAALDLAGRQGEARRRGTALQTAFATSPDAAALPPGVGLSIGCVEVPHEAPDVMAYIKVADERMYANKRAMK